jgi:hypothetical protein
MMAISSSVNPFSRYTTVSISPSVAPRHYLRGDFNGDRGLGFAYEGRPNAARAARRKMRQRRRASSADSRSADSPG